MEIAMSNFAGMVLFNLKRVLSRSKTFRNALKDVSSVSEFSDLYEHEKMLADPVRVDSYRKAIEKYIKPDQVVVDLGTGSGILAIYAAWQNPEKVYAIDHSKFISTAERIARANGVHSIQFQKVNSRSFHPDEKVDVILHEQIGDELLEENMIENLLDLKTRVLKEDGFILPGRFELFVEPVSLKKEHRVPFMWQNDFCGIDFSCLKGDLSLNDYVQKSYHFRYLEHGSVEKLVGIPRPVLQIDLNREDFSDQFSVQPQKREVLEDAILDGFCIYFRVIFDDEIHFDTSPLSPKTSWGTRLVRTENKQLRKGERLSYRVDLADYTLPESWKVTLQDDEQREKGIKKMPSPIMDEGI
jgi:type I protein arginine methyltransferase